MAFGDWFQPKPIGTVNTGARKRDMRSKIDILVPFVISVLLLGLWSYFILWWTLRPGSSLIARILVTAIYLALGYFVHPEADTDNLGWFGGLMNNPFRFSDDINRFLLFLMILLWPGRFVSESIVDMARTIRSASQK